MTQKTFQINERVQLRWDKNYTGYICEIEPALIMNNAILTGEHYVIQYDNGDKSGKLSYWNIVKP